MTERSSGQQLALDQLFDIAHRSAGALEIMGEPRDSEKDSVVWVDLSLATRSYQAGGLALRDRERLQLAVHADFPFQLPWLFFNHKRFLGAPHVQWGRFICLYQSAESEWTPADGLFGFFDRVVEWFTAAGAGELDPDDAPLHPPVAYTKSSTVFVMSADAPGIPSETPYWLGRADLKKVRPNRFDVTGWTHLDDWPDEQDGAPDIAAAILLRNPLPMEYPSKVNDLTEVLKSAGVSFEMLYRLWRLFALMTPEGEPAYFVLGAPMRRKAAGEPRRQHLTVWEIEAEALETLRTVIRTSGDQEAISKLAEWMITADARWCPVMEDRAEIVHRRDRDTPASALKDQRVLLFGCGALGSAIAEMVVRAGAASILVVDKGVVTPGILARQRFSSIDIGLAKSTVLCERLLAFGLPCLVEGHSYDLSTAALSRFNSADWDLVIDATASNRVGHRLERELSEKNFGVPIISVSVSASAQYGSAVVRMPSFRGGPQSIARQSKLDAFSGHANHPLVKAFWPAQEDIEIFQPEPGCSAPTFVGSAADIDHHAGALLNIGLTRTKDLDVDRASMDLTTAPWLSVEQSLPATLQFDFHAYPEFLERRHNYSIFQSNSAQRGIASEIRRIGRTRSPKIETGGLMFGEIDDSHRVVWIDSVSGPPPDSKASEEQFLCGTSGTRRLAQLRNQASGGSSRFIGIWHTHPVSRGRPSNDDLAAMANLLLLQEFPPRQVLMLIVGYAATKPVFSYYLYRRNEFHLVAVEEEG